MFDDVNLVSCAGLVPVMTIAVQMGLPELLADKVHTNRLRRPEISAQFDDVYGASASRTTVSRITDRVLRRCRRGGRRGPEQDRAGRCRPRRVDRSREVNRPAWFETGHLDRVCPTRMATHPNCFDYFIYYGGRQGDALAMKREFFATGASAAS